MIRHAHSAAQADGPDTSVIQPSDWNAAHLAVPQIVPLVNASVTWSNMPNTPTEFTGNPRTKLDLTEAIDVRLVVDIGVVGSAGATLKAQYSPDQAAWNDLTPTVAIDALDVRVSAWEAVPAGAKADVFLRLLGAGGNGTLDPQLRLIQVQVR